MFKINMDKKSDCAYIRVGNEKILYTEQKEDWLMFDYSTNNKIVGIEILEVSKHKDAMANPDLIENYSRIV
jgi:uncharacterized protein YuzE